jgi:hypothetical protein
MDYISLSTCGGVTGGSSGIKLYIDGKLMKILKFAASSPEMEIFDKNINLDIVKNLENMFTISILNQKIKNKASNASSILIYKRGNVEYQWEFPVGNYPDFLSNILDEIYKLYKFIN